MEKTITFNVEGEYITQTVREQFFMDGKDYDKVMELLTDCMCGTDMSEAELCRLAEDVLLGRAEFKGNTANNTYHLVTYGPGEEPEQPDIFHIFKAFARMKQELKETEKELHKMQGWYSVAMEYVPSYKVNEVLAETGQTIRASYSDTLLSAYMERTTDEEEHTTEDYGWLAPDGTFHAVDWAEHQEWAEQYIRKTMSENEWLEAGTHLTGNVNTASHNSFGDYLMERGWVLLHNPSQGIAITTKNPIKPYTKAQKEFLYDYWMERGKNSKAYAIWNEE